MTGTHGSKLEVRTETETMKEHCFLTCSPSFFIQTKPTCQPGIPYRLDPPTYVAIKNALRHDHSPI